MKFGKSAISIIFLSIFNNALCSELQNETYSLFFESPSFIFSTKNQKVQIDGKNSQLLSNDIYFIANPAVTIKRGDAVVDIDSSEAKYFQDLQKLEFLDSVNFYISNEENSLDIRTEELFVDIKKAMMNSKKKTVTIFDNIEVTSIGMNLTYFDRGYNADFAKADIQIKSKELEHSGYANEISMISKDNELIMKGNAYLYKDGFKISADLIHYNFKNNKIIRSVNSTIQSNS